MLPDIHYLLRPVGLAFAPLIDFSTFRFAEPLYLWLLVLPGLLLVLWIWQVVRRRSDTRRWARERVVPISERYRFVGDLAFWICVIVASSLCIGALALPEARISVVRNASADIVLLQDGSASMYATDVKPDRWRRSIQFVQAFADALAWKGDRVALALFAHLASPQVRLTSDPNALFFFLDHLRERSPFRLEEDTTWDTDIEEGVYWGLKLVEKDEELNGKSKNARAFVVISDGQTWSGDVARALVTARQRNTPVYVVGVGTAGGSIIPAPERITAADGPIRAVLDRASLRQIARTGGGEYFELGREPDRDIASKIIASVKRSARTSQQVESYEELYWRFLLAAGVLLCLGTVLLSSPTELWWQAAAAVAAAVILTNALRILG
jgi:Ca-activated chloride channel family protein